MRYIIEFEKQWQLTRIRWFVAPPKVIIFTVRNLAFKAKFSLGLMFWKAEPEIKLWLVLGCFTAPWNVTSERCRQTQEAFLGAFFEALDVTVRFEIKKKNLWLRVRHQARDVDPPGRGGGGEPSAQLSTPAGMNQSRFSWLSVIVTFESKSKLSTWGCLGRCWKTPTTKSSSTPSFRHLLSPLSSFWILVSCISSYLSWTGTLRLI